MYRHEAMHAMEAVSKQQGRHHDIERAPITQPCQLRTRLTSTYDDTALVVRPSTYVPRFGWSRTFNGVALSTLNKSRTCHRVFIGGRYTHTGRPDNQHQALTLLPCRV